MLFAVYRAHAETCGCDPQRVVVAGVEGIMMLRFDDISSSRRMARPEGREEVHPVNFSRETDDNRRPACVRRYFAVPSVSSCFTR